MPADFNFEMYLSDSSLEIPKESIKKFDRGLNSECKRVLGRTKWWCAKKLERGLRYVKVKITNRGYMSKLCNKSTF